MKSGVKICRDLHLAEEILFIDGSWGTGKSILGPVLGSFDRVEKQKLDHIFEYVATLSFLGRMERDAAKFLLNIYGDIDVFNTMISREVNLRLGDDTGVFNNPKAVENFFRLFKPDGDIVKERIAKEKPVLQIMSHHLLHVSEIIFDAFKERVKFVEMVRHPVYMVAHWFSYLHRVGKDSREFTVWIDGPESGVPWFAYGEEALYSSLNKMDRVIFALCRLDKLLDTALGVRTNSDTLVVPFEKFVTDPEPFISVIEKFLKAKATPAVRAALKKQRCPRTQLSAGRGHSRYGWSKTVATKTDKEDFEDRLKVVKENASPEWFRQFMDLSQKYEATYKVAGIGPWK